MMRNEYRRAFIMLRAAMPGYGGHVRLERRTLTGSMYFIITAPGDAAAPVAALAGRRDGEYYVAPIGPLQRDRRGQLALAWQFDPRAIDGRPLEAYQWVVVAASDPCALALTGNVEGSRELDVAALGRAVCAALAPGDDPAADLPGPDEVLPTAAADVPDDDGGDVKIYTSSRARAARSDNPARGESGASESPVWVGTVRAETPAALAEAIVTEAQAGGVEVVDAVVAEEAGEADGALPSGRKAEGEADSSAAEVAAAPETAGAADGGMQSAARQLGLDITSPWPGAAEPLRRLFATQAPLETDLPGDFTYVSAPMPAGSGYDACLIGLRAQDGRVAAMRYALSARYSPEPPAGLECYSWMGEGGEGCWVLDVEVE